ncbi:hypothetical protein CEXT_129141 [Caerostris extrusa]|uniref:Uncharacterized protein n=1 Tax=Caerostris extrusa TaxID=172846 RepID=A0AAV4XUM6_CAEEX|nr:hypothetical protein CEXT_129141 [Caerostris extrusa]
MHGLCQLHGGVGNQLNCKRNLYLAKMYNIASIQRRLIFQLRLISGELELFPPEKQNELPSKGIGEMVHQVVLCY